MDNAPSYRELIQANAKRIAEMHARVHETSRHRSTVEGRKLWQEACTEFHAAYDSLAFPGGYESGLARVRENDPDAIEAALVFLELRPYFFRSGYMRSRLMRRLKHATLSEQQAQRFAVVQESDQQWYKRKRGR